MSRKKNIFQNQKLFSPSVVRRYTTSTGVLRDQTQKSMSGSTPDSITGSFRLDPPGSPIKSTQQLAVDFSKFENHTFFSSAMTNVNVCFEKIINGFPFDGTRTEYEEWLDGLTGFEHYILKRYPSYIGYLTLRGDNRYVEVKDRAGTTFPSISRRNDAATILNPTTNPIFIEMDLAVPSEASNSQFIFHHVSSDGVGYAAYLEPSLSSAELVKANFQVMSASLKINSSAFIEKGKFNHLCFYYDTSRQSNRCYIKSGSSVIGSSDRASFKSINTAGNSFLIGSGSSIPGFTPSQTLSGSINNIRVFHEIRDDKEIERYTTRTLFSDQEPRLNFRLNEATGSYTNSDTVLDHSGQSLHSRIVNYEQSIRTEKPYPMLDKFVGSTFNPTLFPGHPDVIALNNLLLTSGSLYDENNPNLITKLIPAHYLDMARASMESVGNELEGSTYEGIMNPDSELYSVPGGAKIGQPQIISALLFMWSRTFDELKMMIDHVSELVHVDYDSSEGISEQFLPFLSEYYGFDLPNMFKNATFDQFFSGEDVSQTATSDLKTLQNEMWRRVLTNMREVVSSKGTKHSIKTLFRSAGIDPDRIFRFVEYGGSKELRLGSTRRNITEISTLLDFSGSLSYSPSSTIDAQGFDSKKPNLIGTYLSSSRVEAGSPAPRGSFVDKDLFKPHGLSNQESDGLLTSGSWTMESRFRFPVTQDFKQAQSIFRIHVTGSAATHGLVLNLVANPNIDEDVNNPDLTLYCRPGFGTLDDTLSLKISDANIFDGNKWYVSVGRKRNDTIQSEVSSSYFMNLYRQEFGEIAEKYTTSSLFLEAGVTAGGEIPNAFQNKVDPVSSNVMNSSGSFMVTGHQSIDTSVNRFLNHSTVDSLARTTRFSGKLGHLRFWSKALTDDEVLEHAKSFLSLGVNNPLVNFGFNTEVTGAFERLRMDISTDQPEVETDSSGALDIVDFSQQTLLSGTLARNTARLRGFEVSKQVIKPERFDYSIISPNFDEIAENNKVRIAGFSEPVNIVDFNTMVAPVHELPKHMTPTDDTRFSIEFSLTQALNEDIMKIFATLEILDEVIGGPENMFSSEYQGLRRLREVYFNRLTGNVNYTSFFEFFRWLDESFDILIEKLIPKKTNYLGFNMIVEPHALERARVAYGSGDIYLGENDRRNLKGVILLRQLLAKMKRY